jgi:hypothetical protein
MSVGSEHSDNRWYRGVSATVSGESRFVETESMNRQHDIKPYWQDEDDWLCMVEFLPSDDLEGRVFAADMVGYLFGYAQLANARTLALVGDPEAGAYELLFSFSTPGDKGQFLDLVRSNEVMGSDYIENDFMSPTTEEIRNARPLVAVLPEDILSRATLIALAICAAAECDPLGS